MTLDGFKSFFMMVLPTRMNKASICLSATVCSDELEKGLFVNEKSEALMEFHRKREREKERKGEKLTD